jgi:thioesterase domain-containing protein/acyl carrier protein
MTVRSIAGHYNPAVKITPRTGESIVCQRQRSGDGAGRPGGLPNVPLTDVESPETIVVREVPPGASARSKSPPRPLPAALAPLPQPLPAPWGPVSRPARKAVARAWTRVLDRRSWRADLPFDEAGGDSLRLIRLIFELESQCGISLELARFPGDLRPSDMARVLDRCLHGMADADAGAAPDVFLLPAIGGDDPRLVNLRATCRSAVSVELVEFGDWPDMIVPGYDLAALVDSVVAQIEDRAPSGALRLAGWSYGGLLSVAIASALCKAGREVAFLGILDTTTSPLTFVDLEPQRRPTRMENLRQVPAWIRGGEFANRLADFIVTRLVVRPRLLRLAAHWRHAWLPFGFGFHLNRRMGLRLRRDLVEKWRLRRDPPPPLRVASLVLFRAECTEPFAPDEVGWCAAYRDLRIVQVTGDHTTMLEPPHLATLCARFTEEVLHTC